MCGEEETGIRGEKPCYPGGRERADQVRTCLNLIAQYRAGCQMTPQARAMASTMSRMVSQRELEDLCRYYNDGLTQARIASITGRAQSSVSRTLRRGERNLDWALALTKSFL